MSAKSVLHLLDADIAEDGTAVLISGIRTVRAVIFLVIFIVSHATAHAHRAASPFYRAVDYMASGTPTGSDVVSF